MKYIKVIFPIIIVAAIGLYFVLNKKSDSSTPTSNTLSSGSLTSPTRMAEINGYVLSIEGNELTIANELGLKEVSDEERARRQKLTQEERQALKAQESANVTKENVTLTIPVGVTIVKGTGDASGNNLNAEMSEITKGVYISIWKSGDNVEFVKLKGVSGQ